MKTRQGKMSAYKVLESSKILYNGTPFYVEHRRYVYQGLYKEESVHLMMRRENDKPLEIASSKGYDFTSAGKNVIHSAREMNRNIKGSSENANSTSEE